MWQIKDLVLSLLWCSFDPWLGTSTCPEQAWPKKKKKKKTTKKLKKVIESVLLACWAILFVFLNYDVTM